MTVDTASNAAPSAPAADLSPSPPLPPSPPHRSARRKTVESLATLLIGLLLFRAVGAEPYGVPTGSMAPTLLGNHQTVTCPDCGLRIDVGRREGGTTARNEVACPNCGRGGLSLEGVPVCRGDQLLVSKSTFDLRRPRRWEMIVFRRPAEPNKAFVKRIVGLPGELVEVRGGDVFIDHQLARKARADCRAVRIPVFDDRFQPDSRAGAPRWETLPPRGPAEVRGSSLQVGLVGASDDYEWLVYRHGNADEPQARPVTDEYSYNGADPGRAARPVHDFLVECELDVVDGDGWVALGITDGADECLAELPVGTPRQGVRLGTMPRGGQGLDSRTPAGLEAGTVYRTAPAVALAPGKSYRLELALVDRRVTLALDGREPFPALDLAEVENRTDVIRPVKVGARGVEVRVRNFRLFRDVHYTNGGRHGTEAPVRLGAGQYFVLGDNSPNSEDSRFWSDELGRPQPVNEAHLLGKPFLVHLPSRAARWDALGRRWEHQGLDWGRVRWLR